MKSILKKALALSLLVSVVANAGIMEAPVYQPAVNSPVEQTVPNIAPKAELPPVVEIPAPVRFAGIRNAVSGAGQWIGSTRAAQFVSGQASNLANSRFGTACGNGASAVWSGIKAHAGNFATATGKMFAELQKDGVRAFAQANPKLVAGVVCTTAVVGMFSVVAVKKYRASKARKAAEKTAQEAVLAKAETKAELAAMMVTIGNATINSVELPADVITTVANVTLEGLVKLGLEEANAKEVAANAKAIVKAYKKKAASKVAEIEVIVKQTQDYLLS